MIDLSIAAKSAEVHEGFSEDKMLSALKDSGLTAVKAEALRKRDKHELFSVRTDGVLT